MRGVEAPISLAFLVSLASGNPPLKEPIQYEQFYTDTKVSGSGNVDMSASATDKRIALDYSSTLSGNGDLEMDQEKVLSESTRNLPRNISSIKEIRPSNLNLFECSKITYSCSSPQVGGEVHPLQGILWGQRRLDQRILQRQGDGTGAGKLLRLHSPLLQEPTSSAPIPRAPSTAPGARAPWDTASSTRI